MALDRNGKKLRVGVKVKMADKSVQTIVGIRNPQDDVTDLYFESGLSGDSRQAELYKESEKPVQADDKDLLKKLGIKN